MQITKDDFNNWWSSPIGMEFRKLLKENLDKLAHGNMTNSYARDVIGNAQEVGKYMATLFYYNMTFEELTGRIA